VEFRDTKFVPRWTMHLSGGQLVKSAKYITDAVNEMTGPLHLRHSAAEYATHFETIYDLFVQENQLALSLA
jgi:hypothetical protein